MSRTTSKRTDFLRSILGFVPIVLWTIFCLGLLQAAPAIANETGIRGQALRGPVHPGPSTVGESDEAPLRTTFLVLNAERKEVGRFESDENGRFKALLTPGEYTIVPDRSAPILFPERQKRKVTVPQDGFADLTLRFDTGMR